MCSLGGRTGRLWMGRVSFHDGMGEVKGYAPSDYAMFFLESQTSISRTQTLCRSRPHPLNAKTIAVTPFPAKDTSTTPLARYNMHAGRCGDTSEKESSLAKVVNIGRSREAGGSWSRE